MYLMALRQLEMRAEVAVQLWLLRKNPSAKIVRSGTVEGSFVLQDGTKEMPVRVIAFESAGRVQNLLKNYLDVGLGGETIVIVAAQERIAELALPALSNTLLPQNTRVILGYLEDGTAFYLLKELQQFN